MATDEIEAGTEGLIDRFYNGLAAFGRSPVPYGLWALAARLVMMYVFYKAGMTRIADWDTFMVTWAPNDSAMYLFANEFNVPLIPPFIGAYVATYMELFATGLLALGLFTRPISLAFIGMTAVIWVFVYPQHVVNEAWWLLLLLPLLFSGPGIFSIDAQLGKPGSLRVIATLLAIVGLAALGFLLMQRYEKHVQCTQIETQLETTTEAVEKTVLEEKAAGLSCGE